MSNGNVTVLERDGKRYHLVGTAHISEKSVQQVQEVIDAVKPDSVCVELCSTRYEALTNQDRWKNLDIFRIIKEGKTLLLLANIAMGAYQRRLGSQLGVEPGAELLAGATKAEEIGAKLCLVDRDIQTTLKRTWSGLSFLDKFKLMGMLIASLLSKEELEEDDIERLKGDAELAEMLNEFAKVMPSVKTPLIDERDQYLISKIEEAPGQEIVAVVGAGHIPGMQRYFGKTIDCDSLCIVPPKPRWVSMLKWVIPALLLGAFAFGANQTEGKTLEQMIYAWLLPNSLMAGLMAAIAGGKLLSIITAFVCSPITSLNPLIGAGMVVGLMEAWLRKPTVADCEKINDDVQSFSGIYRNAVTRVLFVAVMANVGSALGAYIGISLVLSYLT